MTSRLEPKEDDLSPPNEVLRAERKDRWERATTCVAIVALGLWGGGWVALGACAAPAVFGLTPAPFSGNAMGAAFARFDTIAVGCGVVALACEAVRIFTQGQGTSARAARLRRYLTILIAGSAVYGAVHLTPTILQLHHAGVRRAAGDQGAVLESLHRQAEFISKATVPITALLMGLHIFTLRSFRDDDEVVLTPQAPGPKSHTDG